MSDAPNFRLLQGGDDTGDNAELRDDLPPVLVIIEPQLLVFGCVFLAIVAFCVGVFVGTRIS
jgi:hypothetical protein